MSRPVVDMKRTIKATVFQPTREDDTLMLLQYAEPGVSEGHPDQGRGGFLTFACPGCGNVGGISVAHPKPDHTPSWDAVKGSLADPLTLSLQPSINCVGCCKWHGYLTDGVFKSC